MHWTTSAKALIGVMVTFFSGSLGNSQNSVTRTSSSTSSQNVIATRPIIHVSSTLPKDLMICGYPPTMWPCSPEETSRYYSADQKYAYPTTYLALSSSSSKHTSSASVPPHDRRQEPARTDTPANNEYQLADPKVAAWATASYEPEINEVSSTKGKENMWNHYWPSGKDDHKPATSGVVAATPSSSNGQESTIIPPAALSSTVIEGTSTTPSAASSSSSSGCYTQRGGGCYVNCPTSSSSSSQATSSSSTSSSSSSCSCSNTICSSSSSSSSSISSPTSPTSSAMASSSSKASTTSSSRSTSSTSNPPSAGISPTLQRAQQGKSGAAPGCTPVLWIVYVALFVASPVASFFVPKRMN